MEIYKCYKRNRWRLIYKSIQAGNGEEIKIFKHKKFSILSLSKVAKDEFQGDLKIKCGKKYFEALKTNIDFKVSNKWI